MCKSWVCCCELNSTIAVNRAICIEESCEKGAPLLFGCTQIGRGDVFVKQESERTQTASHAGLQSIYSLTVLVINRVQVWVALQGSDGVAFLLYLSDEGWIGGRNLVVAGISVTEPDAEEIWRDNQVRVR